MSAICGISGSHSSGFVFLRATLLFGFLVALTAGPFIARAADAKANVATKEELAELTKQYERGAECYRKGKYAEAEVVWRAELVNRQRIYGPERRSTLVCRYNVALALKRQGKFSDAEKELRAVLAICEPGSEPNLPDSFDTRSALGGCLVLQNRIPESLEFYRKLTEDCRKTLGEDHPHTKEAKLMHESLVTCQKAGAGWLAAASANFFIRLGPKRDWIVSNGRSIVAASCIAVVVFEIVVILIILTWLYKRKKRLSVPPKLLLQ